MLVLGLGLSGVAAAELLLARGARVIIRDDNSSPELEGVAEKLRREGVSVRWGDEGREDEEELLVLSPGISLLHPRVETARRRGVPVIGEMELAYRCLSLPLIAVTGTNGKTTTVSLLERILRAGGRRCVAGGNNGYPLSRMALKPGEIDLIVAEVSSFQLETIKDFRPRVAVFLNFSADHLDRYPDMKTYGRAKAGIFQNQRNGDRAVIGPGIPGWIKDSIPAAVEVEELKERNDFFSGESLIRRHNQSNIQVAAAVARREGIEEEIITQVITEFKGIPHRLEYLGKRGGADYYNDSKATNPGAVRAALGIIPAPIIWIAGGSDKGFDYTSLASLARRKVRAAFYLGEGGNRIESNLRGEFPGERARDLATAVRQAARAARPGDTVLLSPGSASFDEFKNYQERGDTFKKLVEEIKEGEDE